ncbi:MAG: DUF4349 domain-containing protein [Chloroflexi bacterium]|nr:DUF4349 domain-containing protein [Chloroflexota bacterium]
MRRAILLLGVALFLLISCASSREVERFRAPAPAVQEASPAAPAGGAMVAEGEMIAEKTAASGQDLGPMPRMIVRRASLSLIVQDTMAAMEEIRRLVEEVGGYVSESNAYRVGEQMQASVTVRVPVSELDRVLEQIKDMAVRVEHEQTSTEDVTAEYTDIESRLRNLEATEQELLALLREVRERPNATAEDILSVHRRLTEVREEIERLKGRQQYLDNLVALATITIELIPDALSQPVIEPGWRPLQTLRSAFRALVRALERLVDLIIWIVVFVVPILTLIAIPFVLLLLLIHWLRRRRQR